MAIIVIVAILAMDVLYGYATGTAEIRNDAAQFRREAGELRIHTLSLLPNLDHEYRATTIDGAPITRHLRTDQFGTIKSSQEVDAVKTTILFLGGSTTETNEVLELYRFPSAVQVTLRQAGLNVRTVNAGVRGHTTQDSLVSYLAHPTYRDADIVVMMHNINDRLWLASRNTYDGLIPDEAPTTWSSVKKSGLRFVQASWDFATYRSNFIFSLRTWLENFQPWTGERQPPKGAVVKETIDVGASTAAVDVQRFIKNLEIFVAIVRANGKHPVLMTQALGVQSKAQDIFNEAVRNVAQTRQVPLIDAAAELSGSGNWAFLGDAIHMNDRGSQAVGELASNVLANLLGKALAQKPFNTEVASIPRLIETCEEAPGGADIHPSRPFKIIGSGGRYPSFSSDGNWLLFQTRRHGIDRIATMSISNSEIHDLTPENVTVAERHPAFIASAPDSFTILFGSGFKEEGDYFERLRTRNWPSMETADLPVPPELGGAIPVASNGFIVFPGFSKAGADRVPDLYSFDPTNQMTERLTNTPFEEWRPAIAPNGDIYFISNQSGNFDLYRLKKGLSNPEVVFRSPEDEWDPDISSNGNWLVFASKQSGDWDLLLMDLRSGHTTSLSDGPAEDWDPRFHPNGKLIIFARFTGTEPNIYALCLFGQKGVQTDESR